MAMRAAVAVATAATAVLGACACGGGSYTSTSQLQPPPWPARVSLISLKADSGFPAPATAHVAVGRINGRLFRRLAALVPRPLPAPLLHSIPGVTICVPVILTIHLTDRERAESHVYRGCQRPPALRPLLRAMCPLLRRPDFCARYRRELVAIRR
jgi:hypothetical protein